MQLAVRLEAVLDPLGVVEPVDAEQDPLRIAEALPDLRGAGTDVGARGELGVRRRVDRDRERLRQREAHRPVFLRDADAGGLGLVAQLAPHGTGEVARVGDPLEADHIGAEESLEHLAAPRQLRVEAVCRERDVVEVADREVGTSLAEHARDELQLVVLHPHRGALGGDLGGGDREASIDPDVRVPPDPAIPRCRDHIVVQRPDRVVREALVVELHLFGAQRHRDEGGPFELEGLELRVRHARPADPRAVRTSHHRFECRDQASRRAAPRGGSHLRPRHGRPAAGSRRRRDQPGSRVSSSSVREPQG